MKQSITQKSKQNEPKLERRQQVEPTTDYGFRWHYLLFPFIPSWLIAKAFALLFWRMVRSIFKEDDSPFAAFYSEDRSNRIAFLFLILFLVVFFVYLYVICTRPTEKHDIF